MKLHQVLQPAIITLQILGLNFGKLSKIKILHTITSLIMCLAVTFYYWKNRKVGFGFVLSKVVFLAAVTRSLGTIVVMIMVLALNYSGYFDKIVHLTQKIDNFDNEFEDIVSLNQKHKKMILVLLVIVNLGLNGLIDWYTVCLVPLNPYQFFLAVQYPRIVVSTFNIVFYMYTLILEERFKLINLIIKQEEFFSPKIKRMVLLHKTLVRVAKSLNQVFAPQLLLWVLLGVMVVTVDLHVFFFTLFNKLLGQYPVGIVGVKNASLFIFDLIFLSFRCTKLCKEANKTAFLWYHIKIDREDEEARDDFIKLGIKLSNDKLEITACRLFKIDNSLILDMFGSVTSYLFIMLQFDEIIT
ncbi:gustatory receptor 147 [Tribolium castaneum]|uniref:Gustatory receptor n=1 Tax=Tribolium castaneum TaxID=7070 RepID=D6X4A4_TRICA|nr:gustatory receptor 147 [Tribolium castaneum]